MRNRNQALKKKYTFRRRRRRFKRRRSRKRQRKCSDAGVNTSRVVPARETLKRKRSDTATAHNKTRRPTLVRPKPSEPNSGLTILRANSPSSQEPRIDPWEKYKLNRFEYPPYGNAYQVRNAQRALHTELNSLFVVGATPSPDDRLSLTTRLQRMDPRRLEALKKKYERHPHAAEHLGRQKKIIHLILKHPEYTAEQIATMFS